MNATVAGSSIHSRLKRMRHSTSIKEALRRRAEELGLSALGVTTARRFESTEAEIGRRRRLGLLADLKFTARHPEKSCNPLKTFPQARSIVSVALVYFRQMDAKSVAKAFRETEATGRLPRYAWADFYADLRAKLRELAIALKASAGKASVKVFVDRNDLVDREAAVRAGIGWYGKSTNVLTRKAGSWVVLGELVTDVELEPDPPLSTNCGTCTRCIEACPTQAIVKPGVLDASRCISYWSQSRHPIPPKFRTAMGTMIYGCDICQEVCPVNQKFEQAAVPPVLTPASPPAFQKTSPLAQPQASPPVSPYAPSQVLPRVSQPAVPLSAAERLVPRISLEALFTSNACDTLADLGHLFVPRRRAAYLRRNAAVVAGNLGDRGLPVARRATADRSPLVRRHGAWALGRIGGRTPRKQLERISRSDPSSAVRDEARLALQKNSHS